MDPDTQHHPSVTYQLFENADPQYESLLFRLPGEVRNTIYTLALANYEDTSNPYDKNTYWFRPHYSAPRKSDCALVRTCKRVYQEAWFKLWSLADHTFWLTDPARAPSGSRSRDQFEKDLALIHQYHGDVDIEQVRFFAQMFKLEPGDLLETYLTLPFFHPKSISVTIRHTDWWFWESDEWLRIAAPWVNQCKLPLSTQRFQMELETLVRKKNQLESIVEQMKDSWHFTKKDGSVLTAKHTVTDRTTWRGSSTWHGARWVRDETDPDCVDYYVATVTWEHEPGVSKEGTALPALDLHTHVRPLIMGRHQANISVNRLAAATVLPNTKAGEAARLVLEYESNLAARSARHVRRLMARPGVSHFSARPPE